MSGRFTYIEKETETRLQNDAVLAQNIAAFQQIAEGIGNDLAQNGLTLPDKDGNQQEIHIEIKAEPSITWNRETQQREPRLDRNGNQMTDYTIAMKRSSETLKIFAAPDKENGMRLTGMTLGKWTKNPENNRMFQKYYKTLEIADSPVSDEMKAVMSFIQNRGYIQPRQQNYSQQQNKTSMFDRARAMNQMFREHSSLPDKAEAFAKYVKHEKYGESIRITSKELEPDKSIELKFYRDTPSVKLTDFSQKTPDGKYQSKFLNTATDIVQNISSPLIQEAAAQFRGISPEKLEQARQHVQQSQLAHSAQPARTVTDAEIAEKFVNMYVQQLAEGLKTEMVRNPELSQSKEAQAILNSFIERIETVQENYQSKAVRQDEVKENPPETVISEPLRTVQNDEVTPLKQFAIACNHAFQNNISYGMNENGEMIERPDSKAVYQNRDGVEAVFLVGESQDTIVRIAEQDGKMTAVAIDRQRQQSIRIDDIDTLVSLVDSGNISVEIGEATAKATGLANVERNKGYDEFQKF